jgi:hypothetical protein
MTVKSRNFRTSIFAAPALLLAVAALYNPAQADAEWKLGCCYASSHCSGTLHCAPISGWSDCSTYCYDFECTQVAKDYCQE